MLSCISLSGLTSLSNVSAYEAHIIWDPEPKATHYKVEQSVDLGATWTLLDDTLTTPSYVATVPDTGLTLLRASNCDADGCLPRPASGIWVQPEWSPMQRPQTVGVE